MLKFMFYVKDVIDTKEKRELVQTYHRLIKQTISHNDKEMEMEEIDSPNENGYTLMIDKETKHPIYMIDNPYSISNELLNLEEEICGEYGFCLSILNSEDKIVSYQIPLEDYMETEHHESECEPGCCALIFRFYMDMEMDDERIYYHQKEMHFALRGNEFYKGTDIILTDITDYISGKCKYFKLYLFGNNGCSEDINIGFNLDNIMTASYC